MFKTAKTLKNAATQPKGKHKDRKIIPMKGVERLAHLDAVIKAATSAKEVLENGLSDAVRDEFLEQIKANGGQKPDSFYGSEGLGEVNFQLRKRGANSALNEEERKILDDAEITYKKEVITPQLFAINPKYAADEKMLGQVEKALAKLGLPEDFIVVQEEKVKYVIDEDCYSEVLKSNDIELVKIGTCLAFKPTLTEMKPHDVAKTVEEILGIEQEEASEEAPAEKKPARKPRASKASA